MQYDYMQTNHYYFKRFFTKPIFWPNCQFSIDFFENIQIVNDTTGQRARAYLNHSPTWSWTEDLSIQVEAVFGRHRKPPIVDHYHHHHHHHNHHHFRHHHHYHHRCHIIAIISTIVIDVGEKEWLPARKVSISWCATGGRWGLCWVEKPEKGSFKSLCTTL